MCGTAPLTAPHYIYETLEATALTPENDGHPRPLRALHVLRPAAGGMRQHIFTLFARLQDAALELGLAGPGAEAMAADLQAAGVSCEACDVPVQDRPSPGADLRAALRLRKAVRAFRPDIIHAHGVRAGWVCWLARLRQGYLVTAHNLMSGRGPRVAERLAALALRRADCVLAVSEGVQATLLDRGVEPDRVFVVPNGIPLPRPRPRKDPEELRRAAGCGEGGVLVACVARLMRDKGVDLLVSAWPAIQREEPQARCIVAGDGPERAELEAEAPQGVTFCGYVDDIEALYGAADILVIPSRLEGQSIVCLEAMAAQRPPAVAAARVGGLPEMVRPGQTGVLFAPEDADALAQAVCGLARDGALRRRLAENARRMVETEYSAETMAGRVLGVYTRCEVAKALHSR